VVVLLLEKVFLAGVVVNFFVVAEVNADATDAPAQSKNALTIFMVEIDIYGS